MPSVPNPVAVAAIRARTPVGSPLNTEGWSKVPLALRESAQFSAEIEKLRMLQRIQDRVTQAIEIVRRPGEGVSGGPGAYQTKEKFVAELQKIARDEGLDPRNFGGDPSRSGGLQDPTSVRRLGLIYDIQIEKAQEFAKWKMDQDPDVLNAYPAQEFIRVAPRKKKRTDWARRWKKAGGRLYRGRMIALKTDPVWTKLSRFGVPYPPFDFGSGMGLRDISRRVAVEAGLLKKDERLQPIERDFNEKLEASVKDLGPKMQSALKRRFGDQVEIKDGVARWIPKDRLPPGPPTFPKPAPRPIVPPKPAPPPVVPPIVSTPPVPPPIAAPAPKPAAAPLAPPRESTRPVASTAVSGATRVEMQTKKAAAQAKEVLDAIDNIHGDGPLEPIPFNHRISRRSRGTYYSVGGGFTGPGKAVSIGVGRKLGDEAELTLAHEVGHWIDNIGIKSSTKFASEADDLPAMRGLMDRIRQSEAIRVISKGSPSDFRSYLLSGREMFARAYAQFIAEESGRGAMLRSLGESDRQQWTSEDFAPIRAEFRKLFRSLGWYR